MRFDRRKKEVHNLVSLLQTKTLKQGKKKARRSLTIEQPISVGTRCLNGSCGRARSEVLPERVVPRVLHQTQTEVDKEVLTQ